jgi:hypothetical protein
MRIYWSERFLDYFFESEDRPFYYFCCVYDLNLNECGWSPLNIDDNLEYICDVKND